MTGLEEAFAAGMETSVRLLEAAAAAVVLLAAARALLHHVASLAPGRDERAAERRRFARSLLLALDFTIGSDLLKVALAPTLEAAAVAGVVVLARAVLALTLEHELRGAERRSGAGGRAA